MSEIMGTIAKKKNTISISDEDRLAFPLCCIMIGSYIRNATVEMNNISGAVKSMIATSVKAFILVSLLLCLLAIIRRLKSRFVLTLALGAVLALLHMWIFPQNNRVYTQTLLSFVTTILPGVICAHLLTDYERLYDKLIVSALVVSSLNIIVLLLFLGGAFLNAESMGFSMTLVAPTNILTADLVVKKTKKTIPCVFFIISNLVTILAYGSRGSLVAVFAFALILYISFHRKESKNKVIVFFVLAIVAALMTAFSNIVFEIAIQILEKLGISSRSLQMLMTNSFLDNNGRIEIWRSIASKIAENPFAIRGINADQLLQTGLYQSSNTSHNIILEMCYSFGVLWGSLICLYFAQRIVKTCRSVNSTEGVIGLTYLFAFFPICLWSGTMWENANWWIWLAI